MLTCQCGTTGIKKKKERHKEHHHFMIISGDQGCFFFTHTFDFLAAFLICVCTLIHLRTPELLHSGSDG